jgi:predicted transcriptional regulator
MPRAVEEMSADDALDRAHELAFEFLKAGREDDALVMARLIAESTKHYRHAISDEELDRRLEEADADIAAGRVTPHEEVWRDIQARRTARRAAARSKVASTP